jgi:hypothetical protein
MVEERCCNIGAGWDETHGTKHILRGYEMNGLFDNNLICEDVVLSIKVVTAW